MAKLTFKFLKSKTFWLYLAHVAVASGSVASSIMFPGSAAVIVASQALVNGIIPSPIKTK